LPTPPTIDLVIKSFSRDYTALKYLLRSIVRNLTGYRNLYLFLDDEDGFNEFYESIRNLASPQWQVCRCDFYSRSGYLEQQLYKLNFSKFSDADFILPLDSDMIIYRESTVWDWLLDGKAVIPFGNWESLCAYPPVGLHSRIVKMGLEIRHSIDQMISFIKESPRELGCSNLSWSGNILSFVYEGSRYSLDSSKPHRAWLSSIRQLSDHPIDTMKAHYMLSRNGIDHVHMRISKDFGMSLDVAVDSYEVFPVFSEYQVYGNLINENPEAFNHTMIGPDNYSQFTQNLPVIKCNSRQSSSYSVYDQILDGFYSEFSNRNYFLQTLRAERQLINPLEDWC
jgi:hypothetical protein